MTTNIYISRVYEVVQICQACAQTVPFHNPDNRATETEEDSKRPVTTVGVKGFSSQMRATLLPKPETESGSCYCTKLKFSPQRKHAGDASAAGTLWFVQL